MPYVTVSHAIPCQKKDAGYVERKVWKNVALPPKHKRPCELHLDKKHRWQVTNRKSDSEIINGFRIEYVTVSYRCRCGCHFKERKRTNCLSAPAITGGERTWTKETQP